MTVRRERSGWRDESISRRHRHWGVACHAVDFDFILIEHLRGDPKALVEYKHQDAPQCLSTQGNYKALISLADAKDIPCFACRYAKDFSDFLVTSLNKPALHALQAKREMMTEKEWVSLLHTIRGMPMPEQLFDDDGNLIFNQDWV